jgi:hypothetical protein
MKHLIGKNDMIIEQSKEYNVRKCSVWFFLYYHLRQKL